MARIDRPAVVASLDQGQSISEVAVSFGVHENSIRAILRIARNQCVRCLKQTITGRTLCADCAKKERERIAKRRKEHDRMALCRECGEPRCVQSRYFCEKHRLAALERTEKYAAKKKLRGASTGGKQSDKERRRRLIEKYGLHSWERWQRIGGKCETCAAAYGDVAVHLHHIDENPSNNAPENHVFLCFDCHRAVHLLLSSKDRIGLVSWFESAYKTKPLR